MPTEESKKKSKKKIQVNIESITHMLLHGYYYRRDLSPESTNHFHQEKISESASTRRFNLARVNTHKHTRLGCVNTISTFQMNMLNLRCNLRMEKLIIPIGWSWQRRSVDRLATGVERPKIRRLTSRPWDKSLASSFIIGFVRIPDTSQDGLTA